MLVDTPTPVAEGLFEIGDHGPQLIGSRCLSCSTIYFPQAISCRNPVCRDKSVERALLPATGHLYSYTIQRYRPPPLFRSDDWAPYAIGLVDLGDGLQVMGMLTGIEFDAIAIGMPVKLILETLYTDSERGKVVTYKFTPCDARVAA